MYKLLTWFISKKNISTLDVTRDYIDTYIGDEFISITDSEIIIRKRQDTGGISTYKTIHNLEYDTGQLKETLIGNSSFEEDNVETWSCEIASLLINYTFIFVEFYNNKTKEFRIKTTSRDYINIVKLDNTYLIQTQNAEGYTEKQMVSDLEEVLILLGEFLSKKHNTKHRNGVLG